jgi:hypothetical protein
VKGRGHLGDLGIDGRVILKFKLKKLDRIAVAQHCIVVDPCGCGVVSSDPVTGVEFLDELCDYQLLRWLFSQKKISTFISMCDTIKRTICGFSRFIWL